MRLPLLLAVAGSVALSAVALADTAHLVPALAKPEAAAGKSETAVFAGGCFWGVEGVFEQVKGVRRAVSGYAGGSAAKPDYGMVSSGTTGAAEAVRVDFDPSVVSYADLLRIYFSVVADPTLKNRQGPDVGTQYRTALFPVSASQARQAKAYIAQLNASKSFSRPVVTTIESGRFVTAEAYHQDYMRHNPRNPYILVNDAPKVAALRKLFPRLVR
jgi:peptide-methionine (S)-S-oxide reductase